jgi:ELWxxDGT repeat protein
MKATIPINRALWVYKPYLILLFSIVIGLALTHIWLQVTVQASADLLAYSSSPDPYLFKDIEPGDGWSQPSNFFKFNGQMYFEANDSAHGYELWRTDGTITGTVLFMDILTGNQSSYPSNFIATDDTLFFTTFEANGEKAVWKSDGTLSGTTRIPNTKTKCEFNMICFGLVKMNNLIYFYGGDQVHGYEPWRTDGTLTGTVMIKDIRPGPESSYIVALTNLNNISTFAAP